MNKNKKPLNSQSGVVLVISLIMLLLLTLIGITGMQTTSLEEKMAGNMRDQNLAFQAAESALKDAENDINNQDCSVACTAKATPARISGTTNFNASCNNGLCLNGTGVGFQSIWADAAKMNNAVSFGTYTNAPTISNVALPPVYLIDGIKTGGVTRYRITAIGYGGTQNAQRILEEIYKP